MPRTLSIKIAQKPHIIGSLGPKALKYESFDAKGKGLESRVQGFGVPCTLQFNPKALNSKGPKSKKKCCRAKKHKNMLL